MIRIVVGMGVLVGSLVAGGDARGQVVLLTYAPVEPSVCAEPAMAWVAAAPAVVPVATAPSWQVARWRYRPVIGGTVSRVRTINYAPPAGWAPAW